MAATRAPEAQGTVAERLRKLGVRKVLVQMAMNEQLLDLACGCRRAIAQTVESTSILGLIRLIHLGTSGRRTLTTTPPCRWTAGSGSRGTFG